VPLPLIRRHHGETIIIIVAVAIHIGKVLLSASVVIRVLVALVVINRNDYSYY